MGQLDHLPGDSDEEHDPRRLVGSDEEYNDKDDEAAQLAAELDETMSRSGSEWSNLVWWGDNQSDIDLREYELRRVSGFTFARPRVAIDRAKESMRSAVVRVKATARDKRAKASAFVDRRKQRLWSGLHSVDERREVALRVIQRAAREKKHALAMRAAGAGRSTKAALRHAGGSSKAALRHGVDIVAGTAEAALDKAVAARDVMAEKREVARKVLSKNLVRGPAYFEDGKKIAAVGTPLCDFFGAQTFELNGEHLAGASATLLQAGVIVPPRSARFVLSLHFMNPRHSSNAPYNVLMIHSASDTAPAEAEGPSAALLRELWDGDATTAVRATLAWLGLDDSRPMLICRQVHASVNRATLPHRAAPPGAVPGAGLPETFDHVEIAFDIAASPLCNQMFR
ncbi:hypothetical protein Ctob_008330 [Chrysochromulina tobinii]|uniref:Uncharacterized protein n=1 Tax=Chrysochromulina tobinii TaxID=1460289 RepID=A0A0M0JYT8_9EUKA|nr:hypothetical protein Ctob_008330 [Chrysochromulina tobinii]|eukprot:KOO31457.1 hypothetical protein Ctob_008330 [Chrysochromulina sp. CCMP291]